MKENHRRSVRPGEASRLIALWLVLAAMALPATVAASGAAGLPLLRAAGPGQPVKAPDLASPAELVRFDPDLIPALLTLPVGARVRIADWPTAPGERKDVLLARHEIYAPGARILEITGATVTEVPRSRLVFYAGIHAGDPLSGVFIAVDPQTRTVESLSRSAAGTYQLRPLTAGKPGLHLVAAAEAFLGAAAGGHKPEWTCGQPELPPADRRATPPREPRLKPEIAGEGASSAAAATRDPALAGGEETALAASSALRTATIAIDTDTAAMSGKFNNDTTAATNYLATLFAAIDVMYNRDLQIQLLQGTTFLRVASDPYTQNDNGNASPAKLSELSNYWAANYANVPRTATTMISGLQGDAYSASGIAWVSGLCDTNYGYNFCQLFKIDYLAGDALIVGHEIGHNFGSVHTHCYQPPIDTCYNLEACYSGPTSCPAPATINGVANVEGTIMSYCHLLGGCSSSMVFHPRTVAVIQPEISAALGTCIGSGAPAGPSLAAVTPQGGPAAGNSTVTLKGSGFTGATTVTFGGVAGGSMAVVDDGTITVATPAHATGAVDVTVTTGGGSSTMSPGYFYAAAAAPASFYTLPPCRLLDTRNANGAQGGPIFSPGGSRVVQAAGICGVPSGAKAIAANVTVVTPGAPGNMTLYPGNAFPFNTSTLNFAPGQVRANNAILALASDGSGTFGVKNESSGSTQFIVDVSGYFQ